VARKTPSEGFETRRVVVVAFDGVVLGDLSLPCEIFARAQNPDGSRAYEVQVCAASRTVHSRDLSLQVRHGLTALASAHTIVVPGLEEGAPIPPRVVAALTRVLQARHPPRVMSICTGAFVLAASGALDGLRVTTHWLACGLLQAFFPRVQVDPAVLFVDHGQRLTSAGAMAGVDLCLHVVRSDLGATQAAHVARLVVAPLERSGGQAQFIEHGLPSTDASSLASLGTWLERNLAGDLSLGAIARKAGVSPRTLTRHVGDELGLTPARWVAQLRVRRAQHLLEATSWSIERVAEAVGFGSSTVLREHFSRTVKVSPAHWRKTFSSRARPAR
jgi:transcriptional regulator GlxA family with amidase domain